MTKNRRGTGANVRVACSRDLGNNPATPVLVKADQSVGYGRVVTAMVMLQQAGAAKVGFLTDPADFDRPGEPDDLKQPAMHAI